MVRRLVGLMRSEKGGIATYVAQAVMILAVLSVAMLVIAATSNLGRFIVDRVYNFMTHAPR
ncbi:MAG TPA: hypothetical protein VNT75_17840 [Symbiobacteriaceae bacterium]|nr:hypothetical protein [Symbiobacteriaceae bacterium]